MSSILCGLAAQQAGLPCRFRIATLTILSTAAPSSSFHSSHPASGRVGGLPTRISRSSWQKNQRKIADLRKRLGNKYAEIGRDKRRSPITTTRSATQLSQPAPTPAPISRIVPFLATPGKTTPQPIVLGNLKETMKAVKDYTGEDTEAGRSKTDTSRSIRGLRKRDAGEGEVSRVLKVPAGAVPEQPTTAARLPKLKLPDGVSTLPLPATTGPGYAYGLTSEEAKLLLVDAPRADVDDTQSVPGDARAEMVRRILSLENANKTQMNKFNVDRCVQLFGRTPTDTGSPEVQAAVMSVKIRAMQDHLSTHKKDMSTKRQLEKMVSQRMKMLKYLRRTNLPKFVETCHAVGVEPNTIRV
ncbi:hypothetical protein DFJ77DRAFT_433062 [Powellomyces hirtus]|nr:hypothetical protein DFJ77DRAFT_433062 [Powellomyces hirtus]